MDRTALAGLLNAWMEGAGFSTQKQLAAAISRDFPIDTGTLSRLLNGIDRVKVSREMIEAFAAACKVEPTLALALAGFVVTPVEWPIPPRLVGILSTWEPWELDMLGDELTDWRVRLNRLRERVRQSSIGAPVALDDNPPTEGKDDREAWTRVGDERRKRERTGAKARR